MNYARPGRRPIAYGDPLTKREIQVVILTGKGLSAKKIGRQLGISPHTTMAHVERARRKLGALNKTHAIVLAIATNHVSVDDFKDAAP